MLLSLSGGVAALGLLGLLGHMGPRLVAHFSTQVRGRSQQPESGRGECQRSRKRPGRSAVPRQLCRVTAESGGRVAARRCGARHESQQRSGVGRPGGARSAQARAASSRRVPRDRVQPSVPRDPIPHSPLAHWVRLEPWPKAVQVTHNGRLLGVYGTDVRAAQLTAGRNEFLFENPACYSERVQLPPGVFPTEVRVRLRWKPALLLVRASQSSDGSPLAADVVVDGKLVGRSGHVVAVPIVGDESSRSLDVQVSASGHKSAVRSLTLRANQLTPLDVQLAPL